MSADSVAADQIRAFFDRWQRLEEEKTAISGDLKELFAEAKDNGFDTKVLRKLFRDQVADSNERSEFEALYDLYASALNAPRVRDARDAREDDHSAATKAKRSAALDALAAMDAEIIDAETGEVTETGIPVSTSSGPAAPEVRDMLVSATRLPGAGPETPPVITSSQAIEGLSSPFTRHGWATSSAGTEGEADRHPIPEPLGSHPTDALTSVAATRKDADTAAPEADHSKPNPICRDPDDCGVYASWHLPCRACLKSAEAAA